MVHISPPPGVTAVHAGANVTVTGTNADPVVGAVGGGPAFANVDANHAGSPYTPAGGANYWYRCDTTGGGVLINAAAAPVDGDEIIVSNVGPGSGVVDDTGVGGNGSLLPGAAGHYKYDAATGAYAPIGAMGDFNGAFADNATLQIDQGTVSGINQLHVHNINALAYSNVAAYKVGAVVLWTNGTLYACKSPCTGVLPSVLNNWIPLGAGMPGAWQYVGGNGVPYAGGWASGYTAGERGIRYRAEGTDLIRIEGGANAGTGLICTLPLGMRPPLGRLLLPVVGAAGIFDYVTLATNGQLASTGGGAVALDVTFSLTT